MKNGGSKPKAINAIQVDNTLDFFHEVLFEGRIIEIEDAAINKLDASFNFLKRFSKNKIIYGINTGFGPMSQYRISDTDLKQLQYNLIRSHSSGMGMHIPPLYVKAGMMCRLINILQAKSGIHSECAVLLKEFINRDITPVIFEHGGVGASGDLVQLAHLALALIGEGEVYYEGKIVATATVMRKCKLKPIGIHIREGLSLINGTSIMTGIAIVNLLYARNLMNWSVMAGSIINEIVDSYDDGFSKELNAVKLHEGQQQVAKMMRSYLNGSKLIKKRQNFLYSRKITEKILKDKVQEYYSLRCMPQVLGPIYDTIAYASKVVCCEANSVNDNPVVDMDSENVYHGGNFHGDYISLEMDKLKISVTKMAMLLERQLNFILNPKLNEKFSPFVNLGVIGLNLGMQGLQFTAVSTAAECQSLSFPNYIHSIPNNNDNQDIVSMGTNSALMTKRVIENAYEILAIYFVALLQGIEYMNEKEKMAENTFAIYRILRDIVPAFKEDTAMYADIAKMKEYLMSNEMKNKIS